MTSEILSDYFTPTELAAELGISSRTLERWRRLRETPPETKIGIRVFYRKNAVQAWIRSREQDSHAA